MLECLYHKPTWAWEPNVIGSFSTPLRLEPTHPLPRSQPLEHLPLNPLPRASLPFFVRFIHLFLFFHSFFLLLVGKLIVKLDEADEKMRKKTTRPLSEEPIPELQRWGTDTAGGHLSPYISLASSCPLPPQTHRHLNVQYGYSILRIFATEESEPMLNIMKSLVNEKPTPSGVGNFSPTFDSLALMQSDGKYYMKTGLTAAEGSSNC